MAGLILSARDRHAGRIGFGSRRGQVAVDLPARRAPKLSRFVPNPLLRRRKGGPIQAAEVVVGGSRTAEWLWQLPILAPREW